MAEPLQLFLAVALMIGAAKAFGYGSMLLGQPAVLGELIAGVLLGPTLINLFSPQGQFSQEIAAAIFVFAEMGVLMLMFAAGLEIDLVGMLRLGRPALLAGVMGVVVPILMIAPAATLFGYTPPKAIFVSLVLASMSTAIAAQVMLELGVLQQREGLTLLGAALIDDLIVILLVSLFLALNPGGITTLSHVRPVWEVLLRMGGFLVGGSLLAWITLPWLANWVNNLPVSEGLLALALVAALLFAVTAEYLGGIATIAGAFIAGAAIGRAKRGTVDRLRRSLRALNYGLLVPLFFIGIGLKANLRLLEGRILPFALVMLLLAIVSKVLGTWIGTRLGGFDRLGALRVGFGMISRGEVGLIMAIVGINSGILGKEVFSVLVLVVLVTTLITPPLVRWSFSDRASNWLRQERQ